MNSLSRHGSDSLRRRLGQFRPSYEDFGLLAAGSDASAIVSASILAGVLYLRLAFGLPGNVAQYFGLGVLLSIGTVVLMRLKGLYTPDSLLSVRSRVRSIAYIWSGVFAFFLAIGFTLKLNEELSRGWILSFALFAPALILGQRFLFSKMMLAVIRRGGLKRRRVLVVTWQRPQGVPSDQDVLPAYHIVRMHVLKNGRQDNGRKAGAGELAPVLATMRGANRVDEVHLLAEWNRWPQVKAVLSELRELPVPVHLLADAAAGEILKYPQKMLGGAISFELQRMPLRPAERAIKRCFDVVVATLGLFSMAPFLLLIALAIKLESAGPVLFHQRRGGFDGRSFNILKFRTMRVTEDGATIIQAARGDPRVTLLGRWLRRASVDELPQLVNVLRGEMSLIGPRPHALAHDDQYVQLISRYAFRQHVKPGITGWAQVHGFRGETCDVEQMRRRIDLDLWYVKNWSFWLDLRILLWTVVEVTRSRNAF